MEHQISIIKCHFDRGCWSALVHCAIVLKREIICTPTVDYERDEHSKSQDDELTYRAKMDSGFYWNNVWNIVEVLKSNTSKGVVIDI